MASPTNSELAALVHDLRAALGQHQIDAAEVRDAARAVLQAVLPMAARDTVAPQAPPTGAPWTSGEKGPATWSPDAPESAGTWAPDALEAGTWAPGALPTDEVPRDASETQWAQGPGLHAPRPPEVLEGPIDLEDWCHRILAGEVTAAEALAAVSAWRPEEGAADRGGRYVIAGELGRGGMGQVLQADDVFLRRTVAIKVLTLPSRAARRRFVDEARLTARLDHPGVVPVHDVGETPSGKPFFAMKRIRGRSLHQVIHTGGMPQLSERLDVFKRVCEAVAFANDAGVLHLDLKPDNVMVGAYGEVLVVDWGLATEVGDGGASMRQVAGTPAYMAPEQATAGASLDRRTDVYALGAVLYELLTDQPPIEAGAVTEMLEQVRTGSIPHPRAVRSTVPRELDALVQRCMSKDPAQRPADALLLRDEVWAFQEHRELQTLQYGIWSRVAKWRQRNLALVRGLAVAGTLGVFALLASTGVYIIQVNQARHEAEVQARHALEGQAESDLFLGRSHLSAHRYQDADAALKKARGLQRELALPTTRVDLAIAEVRAAGSISRKIQVPVDIRRLHTDGRVVIFDDGHRRSGWVDVASGTVHEGPAGAMAAQTEFGLAWWVDADRGHRLQSVHGDWSIHVPFDGPAVIHGRTVYGAEDQVAYDLELAADGRGRATFRAVDHGVCAGDIEAFVGPYIACGRNSIDIRRGEEHGQRALEADADAKHLLVGSALQAQVFDHDDVLLWDAPVRPAKTATYPGGVAWRDDAGRIHARTWATGRAVLDLDATMTPRIGRLAVAPAHQLAVVGHEREIFLLQSIVDTARDPETAQPVSQFPYGIALSEHGLVFATLDAVHRRPRDTTGPSATDVSWTLIPDAPLPRAFAWSDDGRLAVALRDDGLWIVHPDGRTDRQPLEGCCLGVAWRGEDLAAVGRGSELHERVAGTWRSVEIPELSDGAWGVTPWGADGWAVSDYDRDRVYAVMVRQGVQVATIEGPDRVLSFQVASDGERVVVGTGGGAWAWVAGETTLLEQSSYTVAATWAPTGPVIGSADQRLRFYSPDGALLHTWDVGEVLAAIDSDGDALATSSDKTVRVVPVDTH